MSETEGVIIQNFLFDNFRQSSGASADSFVLCTAKLLDAPRATMTNEKIAEVKKLLAHIGRWEQLAKSLSDLGLGAQSNGTITTHFDSYDIRGEVDHLSGLLTVSFCLKDSEALRRTHGRSDTANLDVAEITAQVKNLPKWLNAVSVLRAVITPP
jgi:hypothetical protein